jgi:hypothetical protein
MPRSRSSPGSEAQHWSPDLILGFAEYALFFLIYICLSFSLSLLFRQSLLYDSQFNISIRTRLISTGYEPGISVLLESTSISSLFLKRRQLLKSRFATLFFGARPLHSIRIDAYY